LSGRSISILDARHELPMRVLRIVWKLNKWKRIDPRDIGEERLKRERNTAIKAAREAGKLILSKLGEAKKIDYKSAFNLVTDVDKASEAIIIKCILDEFPGDEILAEESGASKQKSERRWLIDPLDGTTNFAHAYPFFCVSIGLEEMGKRVLGVVFNPVANELFWAEPGEGAWLNDERIAVSKIGKLEESLLATGFAPNTAVIQQNNMENFKQLTGASHGVRRDGAAALDLCFVACGRLDGFWERNLSPWDVAAGSVIVEEAGGKVTDLVGRPMELALGNVFASNGLIHDDVIAALNEKVAI
jgi:myo-inositol-1(or 4)-monophosphatase